MTDLPESAISRAVRADAESAREEMRAMGLTCPSCGQNEADIYGKHRSSLRIDGERKIMAYECRDGVPVDCWDGPYEVAVNASNIALLDEIRRLEDSACCR